MSPLAKRVAALEDATSREWRTLAALLGLTFTHEWAMQLEALLMEVLPRDSPRDEMAAIVAANLGVMPDALTEAFRKIREVQRAHAR